MNLNEFLQKENCEKNLIYVWATEKFQMKEIYTML